MSVLEKRANIIRLAKSIAPQASRIVRTKLLPKTPITRLAEAQGPSYLPLRKLPSNATRSQIAEAYAATEAPKQLTKLKSVAKPAASTTPTTGSALATASRGTKPGKGFLPKGILSAKLGAGLLKKKAPQTVEGANRRLLQYTDKIYSPKGAATGYFTDMSRAMGRANRRLVSKGLSPSKSMAERSRMVQGVRDTLKGKGPAQRMFNMATNRHELAERAVSRRFGAKTPRFYSHLTPRPMLNDMNVAASMSGPGSEAARQAYRLMRKPELRDLAKVVYPRAGRMKYDPRRLLPGTRAQEQAAARMQDLGLPGNRLNRHEIKKILSQYQDAANRNTYAFRRASNPLANADKTNLQFFLQDNPNLRRNLAIGAGGVAGLNKLFRG